jgi:hypothetical protein
MKKIILVSTTMLFVFSVLAQDRKSVQNKLNYKVVLADIGKCVKTVQGDLQLYTLNATDHSREHDVNSIILDIEKYIDSMPKTRSGTDQLLVKQFNPIRHFFLTTTNKTTVATSFLYQNTPYRFCNYNDTALTLYLFAVKDGSPYNLGKMTEKKVMKSALENCLLPSLKAADEFRDTEIKYLAISIYFGCKDSREGAAAGIIVPYCMTLVARLTDIQQYGSGLITAKGLLANAELYVSDMDDAAVLKQVSLKLD